MDEVTSSDHSSGLEAGFMGANFVSQLGQVGLPSFLVLSRFLRCQLNGKLVQANGTAHYIEKQLTRFVGGQRIIPAFFG